MAGPSFGISTYQFRDLFEEPKEKAVETLKSRYGGIEGVASALRVDLAHGLVSDDANDLNARTGFFGPNRLPVPKQRSLLLLMWDALHDLTLVVLLVAGAVSLVAGIVSPLLPGSEEDIETSWIEGAAILVAVAVVVLVSSINDYQKEKQFRKLNAVKEDAKVNVLRDGLIKTISKYDVVVGDIVLLGQGDEIVADGLVLESSSLTANESALTGESDDIKKNRDIAPFLFSGTQVMDGVGKMLVTCVGENSQAGIIHMLITGQAKRTRARLPSEGTADGPSEIRLVSPSADVVDVDNMGSSGGDSVTRLTDKDMGKSLEEKPRRRSDPMVAIEVGTAGAHDDESLTDAEGHGPSDDEEGGTVLQQKLGRLAVMISYVGVTVGVLTFLIMSIRFCIETYTERGWKNHDFIEFLDYFIIGVTVLVVAVPEGLPLAVTLALAFSMTQMLKENNLVRHLDACETMGNATTVCSDKTGTLTTNRMTVTKARVGNVEADGERLDTHGVEASVVSTVLEAIATNSTAEVQRPASGVGPSDHLGSKTECALLQYSMDMGADYPALRAAHKPVHMAPFSSAKKRMAVVIPSDNGYRVHVKGASEIVLDLCTLIAMEDGSVAPLTARMRQDLLQVIEDYASHSLRTLCLAYKEIESTGDEMEWDAMGDELDTGLTCLMLVGIEDPVRPEVPGAIARCERAGITVRMVTGDNVTTARAVAHKCGILHEERGDLVMEGPEFRKRVLDDEGKIKQAEFDKIWPTLRVLARSSPTDKYTLVSGILASELGEDREVVAVTGDGTNDAPALKRADIGFAMGIQGTAVAKNASDIILMDDNFSSIVAALKWGRNIYDAISKFVQFQLTVNVCALVIAFTSAAVTRTTPLTAIQLLFINLIMDTLAALALATEKPTDSLLDRKPYGRNKALISRRMWWFIMMHAAYQITVLYFILYAGPSVFGIDDGNSMHEGQITVHYTIVYNAFVLCQLFNEVNARKLHGEWNVFKGMFDNWFFVAIMVLQFAAQVLIIQFGGEAFKTTPLSAAQWGWCLLFGAGELVWNQLINLVPILIPKSWKVRMAYPLQKSFWIKSHRRVKSGMRATRPFRKSMKTQEASNDAYRAALLDPPARMSLYESAWHVIMSSTTSPKVRLRAAICIVRERVRASEHFHHDDMQALTQKPHAY